MFNTILVQGPQIINYDLVQLKLVDIDGYSATNNNIYIFNLKNINAWQQKT